MCEERYEKEQFSKRPRDTRDTRVREHQEKHRDHLVRAKSGEKMLPPPFPELVREDHFYNTTVEEVSFVLLFICYKKTISKESNDSAINVL